MLNVAKLKKGIVIDHINAGKGFDIYKELHLNDIDDAVADRGRLFAPQLVCAFHRGPRR